MNSKKREEWDEELNENVTQEIPEEDIVDVGDVEKTEQPDSDEDLSGEEKLKKQIEDLTSQVDDMKDKYLRLSAEFDNYRKRTMKEKAELILNGSEKSIVGFLPVVDDLERAVKTSEMSTDARAIKEGIDLIYDKFISILSQFGVKKIETEEKPLDTDYHEAVAIIPAPSDDLRGKILDTIQTGYTMNDNVIRHAKVVVGE